jgi:acyl-CoA oxidase
MDSKELADLLFGFDITKRERWNELLKDPVFIPRYNYESWDETREHPYHKLRKVIESRIVSVKDFIDNPHNIFAAHEFLGMVCGSTAVKFTVQFNLFGGSCLALHTARHSYLFDKIDDLGICGCFCLTELGYGNNAVKMETTVTYDEKTNEFVVNTPTTLAQKYWISNGFKHANHALVFGQTIVRGKNEGVNAFLVPIRGKDMKPLPGVTINDMGVKFGLNGVDNAALKFKEVRIPRVNMMNKYADVDEKGEFHSDVKKIPERFFKVTERLLSGRLCIAGMALGAQKAALYIAIKYAQQRKSIGPDGNSTVPIWDYQL